MSADTVDAMLQTAMLDVASVRDLVMEERTVKGPWVALRMTAILTRLKAVRAALDSGHQEGG